MFIKTIIHIAQLIMVNLQCRSSRIGGKQAGASALEYLVLAAILIVILGVALNNDTVQAKIQSMFEGLFDSAADQAPAA
ncbi:hypothetical protein FWJ25_09210 [Marinobacter salinexigens]|uniref:Uncharacterized protein n=1 Tax=Marinobacter salinexigens TaxID=2919747 RepID=A0A5B0VKA8_9GAMM|nr:hypothetical protein [Marinobacter salinexigens]KAA1174401.1 hypothetical protein FWJ25_09210 [Marinobacter salinexigens]